MTPHLLEHIYIALGQPRWFWPAVMFLIFIVLPLAASAIENLE